MPENADLPRKEKKSGWQNRPQSLCSEFVRQELRPTGCVLPERLQSRGKPGRKLILFIRGLGDESQMIIHKPRRNQILVLPLRVWLREKPDTEFGLPLRLWSRKKPGWQQVSEDIG